ncbi:MAG: hypothetical protein AAGB00_11080 [Planctomycetota bacterium]
MFFINPLAIKTIKTALACLTLAALAAISGQAAAQPGGAGQPQEFNGYYPSTPYTPPSYAPTAPTSPMRHSSTVIEGWARGRANIIKAQADYELATAQARILHSEAKAREYKLRVINTNTYVSRKQLLGEARDAERLKKFESDQHAALHREHREKTVLHQKYRLPASVLDRATGQVAWPETLRAPEFAEAIKTIQTLFTQLAEEGAQYDRLYRESIAEQVKLARNQLRRARKPMGIEWADYQACQKLLVGLKYEAQNWSPAVATTHVAIR